MIVRFLFSLLFLGHPRLSGADEAVRDKEPKIVEEIRSLLPADWECHYEPGAGTKYRPAGLPRPDFVIIVTNPKIIATHREHPKRGRIEVKPIIPLSFYPIDGRGSLLDTIEKQRDYSWAIPSYFGETMSHVVVTSPAWMNEGRYSLDSKKSIRPALILLQTIIPDPEDQSSMVKSLLSDEPDGT